MSEAVKILAAVDRSEAALDLVNYLDRLFAPGQVQVVLFHVRKASPWQSWSLKKDAAHMDQVQDSLEAWERRDLRAAEKVLDQMQDLLLEKGFAQEAIEKKIVTESESVALSIMEEASSGYQAVMVGRRGESAVKDLILGTTASKLLGRLADIPLWVVGKPLAPVQKALIAMDDSEYSLRAVERAATALAKAGAEVTLLHIIENHQSFNPMVDAYLPQGFEEDWVSDIQKVMNAAMDKAMNVLLEAGVASDKIDRAFMRDEPSRAYGIVEYAKERGFGTIVVGRSGMGAVEGLLLGRVSNKLVHMARKAAVWVVG